ncbi:O-acetylhomoserine aminocarboxypropyltransferase, partial [Clostridium botulinum C/D str. DC5]
MINNWGKGTICIQGGYNPESGEPRVLPIYQSTTYKYNDPDEVADLFNLKAEGHMYSRISNPTVSAFEKKVAELEGGVGALAVASGQSATALAILNICKSGDHIVSTSTLYGGTHTLFSTTLKKFGIDVTFVDPEENEEDILKRCRNNTKAIFGETIGNPQLNVLDFEKFSKIAKKINVPFIVDNTIATPYLCNPLKLGANIVVHSATKYIDGHATTVGGIIIDGGNFNWNNGKFKEFTEADPSYHGINYVETFNDGAYIVK